MDVVFLLLSYVVFIFFLLLLGLVVMARERSRRGGSTADEAPPPDYLADLPWWRRALPWTLATAFLIVYVLFLANDFWGTSMADPHSHKSYRPLTVLTFR